MTRKHLVAAIKRIYRPGCQYDQVIIFTGDQGAGKSTIIRRLGGAWAKPLSSSFTGKESAEQLSGGWLFESGELRGWRGADIESIKDFFTRTSDHYRPAYGMTVNDYPRRCVFFATTNDVIFLNDPTGNRRFWPIPVRKGKAQFDIWRDFTDHYRDQIWAEALHYYREGEDTFLHPEQEDMLHNFQGRFTDTFFEDLTATIEEYLDTPLPQDWYARNKSRRVSYFRFDAGDDMIANMRRDKVCLEEIRAECLQGGKFNNRTITTNDLKQAIAKLPKWVEAPSTLRFGTGYGRHRGYTRYLDPLEDPDSDIL
jgi:predicted P-loop ATPase